MRQARAVTWIAVAVAFVVAIAASDRLVAAFQQQSVNPTAKTIVDFQARVKAYLAMQRKISTDIPKLQAKATPQQIDVRQRELGKRVMAARAGARHAEEETTPRSGMARRKAEPRAAAPSRGPPAGSPTRPRRRREPFGQPTRSPGPQVAEVDRIEASLL